MSDSKEDFIERLRIPEKGNKRARQLMDENPKLSEEAARDQAFLDMLQKSFGNGKEEGEDR